MEKVLLTIDADALGAIEEDPGGFVSSLMAAVEAARRHGPYEIPSMFDVGEHRRAISVVDLSDKPVVLANEPGQVRVLLRRHIDQRILTDNVLFITELARIEGFDLVERRRPLERSAR